MRPQIGTEEDVLLLAEPYLQKLCRANWHGLEYEDRMVELQYLFICAWRQFPTNTGHFLRDFEQACRPYMDKLNREAYAQRFSARSLDASIRCKGVDEVNSHFTLHHLLASEEDRTEILVEHFLNSLPEWENAILCALLKGQSKAEIAREHGLTPYRLKRLLESLGKEYLTKYK